MAHELLGNHKPSQEWYTPDHIVDKIFRTFGFCPDEYEKGSFCIFDPCPASNKLERPFITMAGSQDGLEVDWTTHKFIYCNPPTPAAPWAKKAIDTIQESKDTIIIFAAFSEAVLWQVNDLLDYPICWVRNRINWIDGHEFVKLKQREELRRYSKTDIKINGNTWLTRNPNYLKPSKSPRNYNAFVLLYQRDCFDHEKVKLKKRFAEQFSDLGTVQITRTIYKP